MANVKDDEFETLDFADEGEWMNDYEQALQVATEGGTVDWGNGDEPRQG